MDVHEPVSKLKKSIENQIAKVGEYEGKLTEEKRRFFIMALAETGNISRAAETIGVTRRAVYRLKLRDQAFSDAWDEAKKVSILYLEDEAIRRATEGVPENIYHQGIRIDTIRKYSDTLLIFLMKGNMPEKYGDRQKVEHSGGVNITLSTGVPAIEGEFIEVNSLEDKYSDLC